MYATVASPATIPANAPAAVTTRTLSKRKQHGREELGDQVVAHQQQVHDRTAAAQREHDCDERDDWHEPRASTETR